MDESVHVYRVLAQRVLLSAIQDYIRLQHPKSRRTKELREAFRDALDMLFDDEYRMHEAWKNDDDEAMCLEDLCKAAADRENVNVDELRKHVKTQAASFWEEQSLTPVVIPNFLIVGGHVYHVVRTECSQIYVDFDAMIIYADSRASNSQLEEAFVTASLDVVCEHNDIKLSAAARKKLGPALFQLLRQNDCFRTAQ